MKIKDSFVLRNIAGINTVISADPASGFDGMITLNETGVFMWNILKNGATVDELKRIKPIYRHQEFLNANHDLVELLVYLKGERNLRGTYWNLANTLLYDDRYFNMYDLRSYIETTLRANSDYAKEQETGILSYYTRKSLKNTAHSGKFSSDRTIQEYCEDIWYIEKIN